MQTTEKLMQKMEDIITVYKFLKEADYYMLATVDTNQPRVRPFGTANIFEGKLYIETLHSKRTAQQIADNRNVEICAMNRSKDAWIRIAGRLTEDTRIEAKRSMLNAYPFLREETDEYDPNVAVYFFTDATAWISREGQADIELRF